MEVFADLHLHSKYARATSRDISTETLESGAKLKGLNLLGTGDFTHPLWLAELKENLKEDGSSILKSSSGFPFMLTTEVSNVYEKNGKLRKIHSVILAPTFDIVKQINDYLSKYGDLESDGRPTLSLPCPDMVEALMNISKAIMVIPAHIWTPWFGVFGSKSGFDSLEECFEDQTKNIYALETGLSSDPAMNWMLSSLDKYSLVSFSDAHSRNPWRLGRECSVFSVKELTYGSIANAMKNKNPKEFLYTIEFFPEEGKYHLDGHRRCGIRMEPSEAKKFGSICPVCRRKLTVGVLHRVSDLADREYGFVPKNSIPFKRLIPLSDIISSVLNANIYSKKVSGIHTNLVRSFGSELNVLLSSAPENVASIAGQQIAEAILMTREGRTAIDPGYDGEYGKPVFGGKLKSLSCPQHSINDFFKG